MDTQISLVGELNSAFAAAYRIDKNEVKEVQKQLQGAEKILRSKEKQMSDLYVEHRRLTQEFEDLEQSAQYMRGILDDLHVEEVKTKNAVRLTKKALLKAERQLELNTQFTAKDREILVKWRLSLYIAKKFLGIHLEQGPGNVLQVVSWSDDTPIECNTVPSPEGTDNHLEAILWESLSRKSAHYDKWAKLFAAGGE